jgi:hypothetical protein
MTITIEKNIPLPTRAARTGEAKYPIDQLEVGDSFVVHWCGYSGKPCPRCSQGNWSQVHCAPRC